MNLSIFIRNWLLFCGCKNKQKKPPEITVENKILKKKCRKSGQLCQFIIIIIIAIVVVIVQRFSIKEKN